MPPRDTTEPDGPAGGSGLTGVTMPTRSVLDHPACPRTESGSPDDKFRLALPLLLMGG